MKVKGIYFQKDKKVKGICLQQTWAIRNVKTSSSGFRGIISDRSLEAQEEIEKEDKYKCKYLYNSFRLSLSYIFKETI